MGSINFRRYLKSDLQNVSSGIGSTSPTPDSLISLMRVMREKLRVSIKRGSVLPLMHFTYESFELSARSLPVEGLACREGCAHCCNIFTDAYAPEIFFASRVVSPKIGEPERARIKKIGDFSSSLNFDQLHSIPVPCAVLDGNRCSIHSARPLNCRTANSLDDQACKQAFIDCNDTEIPTLPVWRNLGQLYSMTLKGALFHGGLECAPYEWNSSLSRALRDPTLEQRWLQGERVFQSEKRAHDSQPFSHPFWLEIYWRAFDEP